MVIEKRDYDLHRYSIHSTFFPDFYPETVQLIGIFMVICSVCQVLFMLVVWRGFRNSVDILYWIQDAKTLKNLKWALVVIFVQLLIAAIIMTIVFGLKK